MHILSRLSALDVSTCTLYYLIVVGLTKTIVAGKGSIVGHGSVGRNVFKFPPPRNQVITVLAYTLQQTNVFYCHIETQNIRLLVQTDFVSESDMSFCKKRKPGRSNW